MSGSARGQLRAALRAINWTEETSVKSAVWMLAACFSLATLAPAAPAADTVAYAGAETAPAPATAPAEGAPPSVQREKISEVHATVTAIDAPTRMLTLKGSDGSSVTFAVGPEVKNFPQIRVGDKVVVSYYQGLAAEIEPKGKPLSKVVDQIDMTTTAQPGTKPGAGAGTATHGTVVIEKVDTKANTVTFTRPDGTSRTLPVESQEGRDFIAKLKKGDQVEVLYVEAVAIEVRKE